MADADGFAVPRLVAGALRRAGFGLSRELWVVQLGYFLNYLGWGAVMPFEVVYMHEGRGLPPRAARPAPRPPPPAAGGPGPRPGAAGPPPRPRRAPRPAR